MERYMKKSPFSEIEIALTDAYINNKGRQNIINEALKKISKDRNHKIFSDICNDPYVLMYLSYSQNLTFEEKNVKDSTQYVYIPIWECDDIAWFLCNNKNTIMCDNDKRRIYAYIWYSLKVVHINGHVCLPFEHLCDFCVLQSTLRIPKRGNRDYRVHAYQPLDKDCVRKVLKEITERDGYRNADKKDDMNDYFLDKIIIEKSITNGKLYYYHYQLNEYENFVADQICNILTKGKTCSGFSIKDANDFFFCMYGQLPDRWQASAIVSAVTNSLSVITGSAGTGKTWVIGCIAYALEKNNIKTVLVAPTGMAAKRLRKVTKRDAITIHSLAWYWDAHVKKNEKNKKNKKSYGDYSEEYDNDDDENDKDTYDMDDDISFGEKNDVDDEKLYDIDAIIIDEMSMIDVEILYELLKVIRVNVGNDIKLIMAGDPAQLRPVGPGNVLSALLHNNSKIPIVELNVSHRQRSEGLVATANNVRNADKLVNDDDKKNKSQFPYVDACIKPSDDFIYISEENSGVYGYDVYNWMSDRIVECVKKYVEIGKTENFKKVQVIAATKKGNNPLCVDALNAKLQHIFNPLLTNAKQLVYFDWTWRIGDKVMCTENLRMHNLRNGEQGFITDIDENNQLVTIEFMNLKNKKIIFSFASKKGVHVDGRYLSPAYCTTAHKV